LDVRSLSGIDGDTDHYLVRARVSTKRSVFRKSKRERAKTWFDEECQKQLGKGQTERKRMM